MSESLSPNATVYQHEEAWAKIHDLLAAGHWARAREIFDQAVEQDAKDAALDDVLRELALACNKYMDTAEDYYLHGLWRARDIVLALKNAAPQDTSLKRDEAVTSGGRSDAGVPAVAAPCPSCTDPQLCAINAHCAYEEFG